MAANTARQTFQRVSSSSAAKTLFTSSKAPSFSGFTASKPTSASRFPFHKLKSSRLPVQLAGLQSLMPLHSATAAALFTSQLSLHNVKWGCLSEGFATPL